MKKNVPFIEGGRKLEAKVLANRIMQILESKKAFDLECLPVEEKTTLAEYFIIASANSTTQAKTLEDEVSYRLKEEENILPLGVEGRESGRWILLDYGSVIVHIFHREERQFYDLDKLWKRQSELHHEMK